jgi:hypothetical protein
MDYGKSFTFIFEDEKWISKFLVGVVISLVPIVNFAGYGYMVQLLKNVRDGVEEPLPEWDDFGKLLVDGLKFLAGFLVYLIPVILLSFAIIPFSIAADSFGSSGDAFGLVAIMVSCLILLFSFLPLLIYPALFIQFAKNDQIGDMFKLGEMWEMIKADSGNYIIILLLVLFVLGFIASFGILACFIGVFFTAWWAQLASAHMIGQLAQPKEKPATF